MNEKNIARRVEYSKIFAVTIYNSLCDKNISLKTFADDMNISTSEVTKWLSGHYDFTLKELIRVEIYLNIELFDVIKR